MILLLLLCFIVVGYSDPEWKLSVSVWEWHRWLSFVDPDASDKTTSFGVDFSYFSPRVWKEVFELCSKHGYKCRVENPKDKTFKRVNQIIDECNKRCKENYSWPTDRCGCHDHLEYSFYAEKPTEYWNEEVFEENVIMGDPHPGKSTVYIEEK